MGRQALMDSGALMLVGTLLLVSLFYPRIRTRGVLVKKTVWRRPDAIIKDHTGARAADDVVDS